MKALRWLFLAAPLFFVFEANASPADQLNPSCSVNQPCYCTQDWDPVCGMDGETYGNACGARCACMPIAYGGECIDECKVCVGTKLDPVCGEDGETYGNSCYAKCNKVMPKYEGACQPYETPGPGPIEPPIRLQ